MKDNTGRVLTLRVTIMDAEQAKWIWEAYPNPINGLRVEALSNGDMFSERDTLAQAATFYIREEDETLEEAIEAHCGKGFNTVDSAVREAPKNTTPNSSWEIVDTYGNIYHTHKVEV